MSLFQTTVLTKYLAQQDQQRMAAFYEAFKLHFHNAGPAPAHVNKVGDIL